MKTLTLSNSRQRRHTKIQAFMMLLAITLVILSGCSHTEKVLVPPKVELKAYHSIGVIEFSTNAEDTLKPSVTQNLIQTVQLNMLR